MPKKPSNLLRIAVNGHELTGQQVRKTWVFVCDWPEVSERFSGTADLSGAIDLFMAKALANAVTIRELAKGG